MSKDIEGKRNRYAIPVDGVDGEERRGRQIEGDVEGGRYSKRGRKERGGEGCL